MTRLLIALTMTANLTGCMTVQEQLQQDVATCEQFGAEYQSPAHYQCMLIQQQRRDQQAAALNDMIARNAYIVANTQW